MFLFLFFSNLLSLALQRCVMTQECKDCLPEKIDKEPFISNAVNCPFYAQEGIKELCCTELQDSLLGSNFATIDVTFGSDGGGCDICANNLKRFWCEFTCSPNQDKFLQPQDYKEIVDPLNPANIVKVLEVQLTVNDETACDLFSSCKQTPFASQVTAMQTPGGFLSFQGENAVGQGREFINVSYSNQKDSSLTLKDITTCDYDVKKNCTEDPETKETTCLDPHNYIVKKQCECNNCEAQCQTGSFLFSPPTPLDDFDWQVVVIVWASVLLFGSVMTVIRYFAYSKKKTKYEKKQFYDESKKSGEEKKQMLNQNNYQ